jgi:hypothetical protein
VASFGPQAQPLTRPVRIWAVIGGAIPAFQLYVWIRWITGSQSTYNTWMWNLGSWTQDAPGRQPFGGNRLVWSVAPKREAAGFCRQFTCK